MKDAIKNYIEHLSKNYGFQISLHGSGLLPHFDFLAPYNSHECVYCMLVKTSTECWQRCVKGQGKAMEKLSKDGAFFGSCYAGVGEFVFPVYAFGKQIGMISVGGYYGAPEKRSAFASKYGFNEAELSKTAKAELKREIPPIEFVATLILPLSAMMTLTVEKNGTPNLGSDPLYGKILSILHTRYTRKITVGEIANECHYSASFIHRYFKKKSGVTVNEYLKKLRMERAAYLLLNTEMKLEDVAASVGFSDTNYFISFFSSYYKKPPKQYKIDKGQV